MPWLIMVVKAKGVPSKLQKAMGDMDSHLIHGSLGPHKSDPSSAIFAQLMVERNTYTQMQQHW